MKICFVGPANSAHMIKWCNWFNAQGHEIHVISFTPGSINNAEIHLIDLGIDTNGSDLRKLKYLTTGKKIRRTIKQIKPDVVSVHYATSYGISVALSGVKEYILSVWGSDIYDFPQKSLLHRFMLRYSLRKAPHLFSTSQAMAKEAAQYTNKNFDITPFGVDMELFNPNKRSRIEKKPFTIGTVKSLSDIYGIEYILKATAIIVKDHEDVDINVVIAGDGPDASKYAVLTKQLGIENVTKFLGRISQEKAAEEWANMDVAIIPSILYESFGVAAIEAQACEVPVIISDVEGLKETTKPGKSSIVVHRKNEKEIADAVLRLYQDSEKRKRMGKNGRAYVCEKFELNASFEHIEKLMYKYAKEFKAENV